MKKSTMSTTALMAISQPPGGHSREVMRLTSPALASIWAAASTT